MDKARARALLDQERRRLEQLGRAVARDHGDAVAGSSPEDPVDGAGPRIAEETSEALGERLRDRWGALERAEARLAAGTWGASVLSGRPIPDERLEAFPLAELTVQEAAQRDRSLGERREPESRMGPSRDPFRVFDDPAAQIWWRRRLETRGSLATSRTDTTCGLLPPRQPSGDSPAHLLVIQKLRVGGRASRPQP